MRYLELNKREIKRAECCAQQIVRDIMEMKVSPATCTLAPRFDREGKRKFKWWVKLTPLLQRNLSSDARPTTRELYDPDAMEFRSPDYILDSKTSVTEVSGVIDLYPEIKDVLSYAGDRCACGCDETSYTLKGGCLQTLMYAQVVFLIGHAMAESSGATSISHIDSGSPGETLISSTTRFLDNLSSEGLIFWGDWF